MGTTMKTGKMLSGEGEETELRLGLPGGGGAAPADGELTVAATAARKRGFSETEEEEDQMSLKLNLQLDGSNSSSTASVVVSSSLDLKKNNDIMGNNKTGDTPVKNNMESNHHHDAAAVKPPAKAQVVGWPPVRSYRKNMMAVQQNMSSNNSKDQMVMNLVKVSIDGAPYLRKVDLKMYRSYQDLSDALGKMFSSFTIGSHGMIDFMNESKLMDLLNGSDYVPTYEDKDGDWMLVGDVPWEMFMESCKRMRIMKGKEAVGLAPRAMEKCKNKRAS